MNRVVTGVIQRLKLHQPLLLARLTRQLPLRDVAFLYNAAPKGDTGAAIPKMLYQTWREPLLGRTHAAELTAFRRRNPDSGFAFFSDRACDAYMDTAWAGHPILDIYRKARFGPLKSDIWRYCILFERGGGYCDIGKGIAGPLATVIPSDATAVLAYERNPVPFSPSAEVTAHLARPERLVVNWAFFFAPNHPLLKRVIDGIIEKYPAYAGRAFARPKEAILAFSGPQHLTECVHAGALADELRGVHFAGTDFEGRAILDMPGSYVRYIRRSGYARAPEQPIVD